MASDKIAIVTGGNKGIGFAIVKGLCAKFAGKVYLTSRDPDRGLQAVAQLKDQGYNLSYLQLDIDDDASVKKFKESIQSQHAGIDVLINNAGIAFKGNAPDPFSIQAEVTVKTNYFGTLRVCEALFPLLKPNARVVHISSAAGHLSKVPSMELKKRFANPELTIPELGTLMEEFIKSAKDGTNAELGWGISAYSISKVGVSALARVQQRIVDNTFPEKNISINSVHPGWVSTDMSSYKGPLSPEEGASAALFLSLENHGLKGQYVWRDSSVVDWTADSMPTPY